LRYDEKLTKSYSGTQNEEKKGLFESFFEVMNTTFPYE
jgi:hypothetical protein